MSWSIIATWEFSLSGVEKGAEVLREGGEALDAIEEAAIIIEDDPEVDSVGYGGLPNIAGEVELDAAIMDGRNLAIGAVGGVKGFRHPISIARKVMTDTPHSLLVGAGAEEFALVSGFERAILLHDKARKVWEEKKKIDSHDTVGIVALDTKGNMASGTSTSGLFMKYRGRVGDSPIPGSGFYVDNGVGGAAATGIGEEIMKGCLCFLAIELIAQGYSPQQAAETVLLRHHQRLASGKKEVGDMSIVCMDAKGNFGAATNRDSFEYVIASDQIAPVIRQVEKLKGI